MAKQTLNGLKVAILVTDGFEQVELTDPRKALEAEGAKTMIVAPKSGKVQGFRKDQKADEFDVDLTLEEAKPAEFDAVLLPGGVINADHLRIEKKAQQFVQQIDQAGKPIAVICHGPWLLVSAGLVKGRKMTSYETVADDLRNAGAEWEDREVIRDRNWVSSRKPADLPAFNREMIELLGATPRSRAEMTARDEARP
jgi:protease I